MTVHCCLNPSLADTCNFVNHFFPVVNTSIVKAAGSVKNSRGKQYLLESEHKSCYFGTLENTGYCCITGLLCIN